jgi:hypothetical protein
VEPQTERMRACNDENSNDAIQHYDVEGFGNRPGNACDKRGGESYIKQPACSFIGKHLCLGFRLLRLLDKTHNTGKSCFFL